jgi:hypothetical protein
MSDRTIKAYKIEKEYCKTLMEFLVMVVMVPGIAVFFV